MDPLPVMLAGIAVFFAVVVLAASMRTSGGRSGRDYEAEADMESHDIDDMLDAINERRRRAGRRDVGEELSDELLRGSWD